MTTPTTSDQAAVTALVEAVHAGQFDNFLDRLELAITARKANVDAASRTYENYPVGSEVRFNERVRPQYLRGERATVVSHNRSRGGKYQVEVQLVYSVGKFRAGHPVRAMFSIIDPVK